MVEMLYRCVCMCVVIKGELDVRDLYVRLC